MMTVEIDDAEAMHGVSTLVVEVGGKRVRLTDQQGSLQVCLVEHVEVDSRRRYMGRLAAVGHSSNVLLLEAM